VRVQVVTSSRIVKNDAAVNFPHSKGLGAVPAIAVAATDLPGAFHADPADRILIATAAEYGAQLVTRDKHIREYARVTKHLRCIAC